MEIQIVPDQRFLPSKGGVREAIRQKYIHFREHPDMELVGLTGNPDLIHVESSYLHPKSSPDVYVCHGGFVPSPTYNVVQNMVNSQIIVSVAQWIVDKYFTDECKEKTVVIPNGVDLREIDPIDPYVFGLNRPYILYAKEWLYYIDDFLEICRLFPNLNFLSVVWPENEKKPDNVIVIGPQDHTSMLSIIKGASALLLTGSEVCPIMLLESWACKTPVIAKNIDGSKELMERDLGVCGGILYNNIEELSLAIDQISEDVLRNHYGNMGRNIVEGKYQWYYITAEYYELYAQLLHYKSNPSF